jgi:hypothetical protein
VKLKRNIEKRLELCQQIINIRGGKGGVEKGIVVEMVVLAVVVILLVMVNKYLIYIHAELNSHKPITELA